MKRDMELIRQLAFIIEEEADGVDCTLDSDALHIDGFTDQQIGYHADLMVESGLVLAISTTHMQSECPSFRFRRLTVAGHDFVDAARNETFWKKAIAKFKETGAAITVDLVVKYLKAEGARRLGLGGNETE